MTKGPYVTNSSIIKFYKVLTFNMILKSIPRIALVVFFCYLSGGNMLEDHIC